MPPILPDTPAFRAKVYNAASEVVLKLSTNGKWVDIIALRGTDRVYIATLPRHE